MRYHDEIYLGPDNKLTGSTAETREIPQSQDSQYERPAEWHCREICAHTHHEIQGSAAELQARHLAIQAGATSDGAEFEDGQYTGREAEIHHRLDAHISEIDDYSAVSIEPELQL